MPQASRRSTTHLTQTNVVSLPTTRDTFITVFMFDQVAHAAQALPPGWFDVSLKRDEDAGVRQDYVMIERIAGPPVGSFQVWRGSRGRFLVCHMGELEQPGDSAESGPYRTVEAAVEAIRADIGLQLAAWGVMPVPCAA